VKKGEETKKKDEKKSAPKSAPKTETAKKVEVKKTEA